MTSPELCPFCHNTSVADGHYYDYESYADAIPLFQPDGIEVHRLRRLVGNFSVDVGTKAKACLHCGKIWADLDLEKLKTLFRKHGTDESKNRFSFDLAR